ETMRQVTPYVAGSTNDPSVGTARGVFEGMKAVLEARFERDDFRGVHVAVQGLGNGGWRLGEHLHDAAARLTVARIRPELVPRAVERFGAETAAPAPVHAVPPHTFPP